MTANEFILVDTLCLQFELEPSFFDDLSTYGLIEIHIIEENRFILQERLSDIEKMIRIHHDLNVNLESIDVIFNLIDRIDTLQSELKSLKNRLSLYEED